MAERKHRWTGAELLEHPFEPLTFFIPKLLTTGVTLLWGSPKSGKSILALQWAAAIATGGWAMGKIPTMPARVAYLSLEDGPRRLQTRLQNLDVPASEELEFFTAWTDRAVETLERYLDEEPETRVVFIDTWQRFSSVRDSNDYSETTDAMARLKRLADDRNIAAVLVHHSRKPGKGKEPEADDFADTALGSVGITAGPDHLAYLARTPQAQADAVLKYRSKDCEPQELALEFDNALGTWALIGDAEEVQKTTERQQIFDVLQDEGQPMGPKQVAKATGLPESSVRHMLRKMTGDGVLYSPRYGKYTPAQPDHTDHTDHTTAPPSHTDHTDHTSEGRASVNGESVNTVNTVNRGAGHISQGAYTL
jgi:predicted transcriptional regulator